MIADKEPSAASGDAAFAANKLSEYPVEEMVCAF
jgi:hypothetical protein